MICLDFVLHFKQSYQIWNLIYVHAFIFFFREFKEENKIKIKKLMKRFYTVEECRDTERMHKNSFKPLSWFLFIYAFTCSSIIGNQVAFLCVPKTKKKNWNHILSNSFYSNFGFLYAWFHVERTFIHKLIDHVKVVFVVVVAVESFTKKKKN